MATIRNKLCLRSIVGALLFIAMLSNAWSALELTQQERDFLSSHPTIRIAPDPDYPPIESIDEKGQLVGIAADYIALIEKQLGIEFKLVIASSWDEAMNMAKSRQVDVLSAATSSPERVRFLAFTSPHVELPGAIFVRMKTVGLNSLEALRGKSVAVVSGYIWEEFIRKDYPDINIRPVADVQTGLKEVSVGEVDAMVANIATATYYIEEKGIVNLRMAGETGYFARLSLAVRNDWPVLAAVLEKTLKSISSEQRKSIYQKWIHVDARSLAETRLLWNRVIVVSGLVLLFIIIVIVWNRTLRRAVNTKTQELQKSLHEHQATLKALRSSEERLERFFHVSFETHFIHDNGKIVDVNEAVMKEFGYRPDELIGKNLLEFITAEEQPEVIRNMAHDLEEPYETRIIRKDRTTVPVIVCAKTLEKEGKKQRVVSLRDITDLRLAETQRDRFFSLSADMLCIANFEGYFTDLSPMWEKTLGFSAEELMQKPFVEFVHPDDLEATIQEADRLVSEPDATTNFINRYLTKQGGYRWFNWNAIGIPETNQIFAVAHDITHLKRIENELRQHKENLEILVEERTSMLTQKVDELKQTGNALEKSQARLQYLLTTAPVVIYTCKAEGDYAATYISNNVETLFGFKSEEFLSNPGFWADGIHPEDAPRVFDDLKQLFASGVHGHEYRFRMPDGSYRWVQDEMKLVYDDSGNPIEIIGYWVDISERKKIDKMKDDFISTVSHELRTPLTSIRGSLALLAGGAVCELPEKAKEMVNIANSNTDRLLHLISDVLDIQKMETGGLDYNFRQVAIDTLVEKAIRDNEGYARQYDVRFVLNTKAHIREISTDPDRLLQVINNLLSNAAKFSPQGEAVDISVFSHDHTVSISVADKGAGIPEDFQPVMFDRFTQLDTSDTRQRGGTGLGLSISRSIVRKLGGELRFQTGKDIGTTFFVDIPISRPG